MDNSYKHSKIQRVLLKVCAVFCAIILTINPVKANAMNPVVPIPPIWLPINPYNTESIVPNAELLSDDQKNILYEIIGAYNHIYLGFGGFVLANPISGVKQWWREYGETFYNSFVQSVVGSPRALIDMVGSATYKASQYDTLQEFEEEISDTSVSNYIEYNPDLTFAFRDWYFNRGGVYQWQFDTKPFETNFSWVSLPLGAFQTTYDAYISELSLHRVQVNEDVPAGSNYYVNELWSCRDYDDLIVYLDSSTGGYGVFSLSDGQSIFSFDYVYVEARKSDNDIRNVRKTSVTNFQFSNSIDLSNYDTIVEAVRAIYATPFHRTRWNFPLSQLAPRCFVGTSWANKQEIYNIDDLDISDDTSTYIDNIGNTGYTDINGLATSLGADIVDIKEGVIENTLVKTDSGTEAQQLTDALLKAIDKFQTTPNSGVVIPTGIFAPVKGFIEYMWYMTKPLIVFTRDVISTLTFGAADGFLNTGPAIFVFGVCAFGLIGGLIVKCLL